MAVDAAELARWWLVVGVAKQGTVELARARGYDVGDDAALLGMAPLDIVRPLAAECLARNAAAAARSDESSDERDDPLELLGATYRATAPGRRLPPSTAAPATALASEGGADLLLPPLRVAFLPRRTTPSCVDLPVGVHAVREAVARAKEDLGEGPWELVLVASGGVSTDAARTVAKEGPHIQVIPAASFLVPLVRNPSVPRHDLLSPAEAARLSEATRVHPAHYPTIKRSDPVARFLGARAGQVVRSVRAPGVSYFRVVR